MAKRTYTYKPKCVDEIIIRPFAYERLSKRSLRTQLAYHAGFETMTNGFTHWLINTRTRLFHGASPYVSSFWLMHMVEETEHKTVAFDADMAYSGQYLPRAFGMFHGSLHVVWFGVVGMFTALKKDKLLSQPRHLMRALREIMSMTLHVGPDLLRGLLPWHNPRLRNDSSGARKFRKPKDSSLHI